MIQKNKVKYPIIVKLKDLRTMQMMYGFRYCQTNMQYYDKNLNTLFKDDFNKEFKVVKSDIPDYDFYCEDEELYLKNSWCELVTKV